MTKNIQKALNDWHMSTGIPIAIKYGNGYRPDTKNQTATIINM